MKDEKHATLTNIRKALALYALAPEMAEALRKLVLLCPSPEGLGGHAPIGAFIQLGEAARAILARLPQKGGEK